LNPRPSPCEGDVRSVRAMVRTRLDYRPGAWVMMGGYFIFQAGERLCPETWNGPGGWGGRGLLFQVLVPGRVFQVRFQPAFSVLVSACVFWSGFRRLICGLSRIAGFFQPFSSWPICCAVAVVEAGVPFGVSARLISSPHSRS
jgi:hypothetical protein